MSKNTVYGMVMISNFSLNQIPGTKIVGISYDLYNSEPNPLTISLTVHQGTTTISVPHCKGDIGNDILSGQNKFITCDFGEDWNTLVGELKFCLSVEDIISGYFTGPCPVSRTGQVIIRRTGDDGDLKKGVTWPEPRFTATGSGTVIDNLTGLEWIQAPHSLPGNSYQMAWNKAIDLCNSLSYAGFSDWRLPSTKELLSLMDYSCRIPVLPSDNPFVGINSYSYLTSTTCGTLDYYVYKVWLCDGSVDRLIKSAGTYVWPVRTRSLTAPSPVPQTGQVIIYRTGDDASLKSGVAWPEPRFAETGSGTVIDNLTGLEWIQSPHSLEGNNCSHYFSQAIDFCNSLEFAGHTDWRLPNIKELESLANYGSGDWGAFPYEWLNSEETPFSGIKRWDYLSSTAFIKYTETFFTMDFDTGVMSMTPGGDYVWPVRNSFINSSYIEETNQVDSSDYVLEVISSQTNVFPSPGLNNFCWGSTTTCSTVNSYSNGLTNYYCNGWIGTGSIPLFGTTNYTGTIYLTNLYSSIEWIWDFEYLLRVGVDSGKGSISITNTWFAHGSDVVIQAFASDDYRFDYWLVNGEQIFSSTNNLASLHLLMDKSHTVSAIFTNLTLAEASDSPNIVWLTGGNSNWVGQTRITHDKQDAIRSGSPGDTLKSWIETTVSGPGNLSFWWKVSSEEEYDWLRLKVDDSVRGAITGETDWEQFTMRIEGDQIHSLHWEYAKDKSLSSGLDCGWIDQVSWTPDLSGFALWANNLGLTGDPLTLFGLDYNNDGIDNAFDYAFGTNIISSNFILNITNINQKAIVEIPVQDPDTLPFVSIDLKASSNLVDWTLQPVSITNIIGQPSNLRWYELQNNEPKAFFKIEATLK